MWMTPVAVFLTFDYSSPPLSHEKPSGAGSTAEYAPLSHQDSCELRAFP